MTSLNVETVTLPVTTSCSDGRGIVRCGLTRIKAVGRLAPIQPKTGDQHSHKSPISQHHPAAKTHRVRRLGDWAAIPLSVE